MYLLYFFFISLFLNKMHLVKYLAIFASFYLFEIFHVPYMRHFFYSLLQEHYCSNFHVYFLLNISHISLFGFLSVIPSCMREDFLIHVTAELFLEDVVFLAAFPNKVWNYVWVIQCSVYCKDNLYLKNQGVDIHLFKQILKYVMSSLENWFCRFLTSSCFEWTYYYYYFKTELLDLLNYCKSLSLYVHGIHCYWCSIANS